MYLHSLKVISILSKFSIQVLLFLLCLLQLSLQCRDMHATQCMDWHCVSCIYSYMCIIMQRARKHISDQCEYMFTSCTHSSTYPLHTHNMCTHTHAPMHSPATHTTYAHTYFHPPTHQHTCKHTYPCTTCNFSPRKGMMGGMRKMECSVLCTMCIVVCGSIYSGYVIVVSSFMQWIRCSHAPLWHDGLC